MLRWGHSLEELCQEGVSAGGLIVSGLFHCFLQQYCYRLEQTLTFCWGSRVPIKPKKIPMSFLVPMNAWDETVSDLNHCQMLLCGEQVIPQFSVSTSISLLRILTAFLPDLLPNFRGATALVFIQLLSTQNEGGWMAATPPLETQFPKLLNKETESKETVPVKCRTILGSREYSFFYCIRFCWRLRMQDALLMRDRQGWEGGHTAQRGTAESYKDRAVLKYK